MYSTVTLYSEVIIPLKTIFHIFNFCFYTFFYFLQFF